MKTKTAGLNEICAKYVNEQLNGKYAVDIQYVINGKAIDIFTGEVKDKVYHHEPCLIKKVRGWLQCESRDAVAAPPEKEQKPVKVKAEKPVIPQEEPEAAAPETEPEDTEKKPETRTVWTDISAPIDAEKYGANIGKTEIFSSNNYAQKRFLTDLLFALTATNKDDPRDFMKKLHVRGEFMFCTDGHRCHFAEKPPMLEDGEYTIVSQTKSQVVLVKNSPQHEKLNFPKVVNDAATGADIILDGISLKEKDSRGDTALFAIYKAGIFVNSKYLKDIIQYDDTWTIWASSTDKLKPVFIENHTKKAVLMPVRI